MKIWLSWSSGKDSAWALQVLRGREDLEVVGLLTTVNTVDRDGFVFTDLLPV